ncbi:MAG: MATE family efflux transporter, partial [Gluconacetobacter liquefaciens]
MGVVGCLIYLLRARIVAFYLDPSVPANAESMRIATAALLVAAIFQMADGTQAVLVGVLRGREDAMVPMVLAVAGYWGVGFPLANWLAFRCGFGVVGLWGGVATALVVVALMLGARVVYTLGRERAAVTPPEADISGIPRRSA